MPSAAILDAQSTHHSPQGGTSGYDAVKKVRARKRHVLVDPLELVLAVSSRGRTPPCQCQRGPVGHSGAGGALHTTAGCQGFHHPAETVGR